MVPQGLHSIFLASQCQASLSMSSPYPWASCKHIEDSWPSLYLVVGWRGGALQDAKQSPEEKLVFRVCRFLLHYFAPSFAAYSHAAKGLAYQGRTLGFTVSTPSLSSGIQTKANRLCEEIPRTSKCELTFHGKELLTNIKKSLGEHGKIFFEIFFFFRTFLPIFPHGQVNTYTHKQRHTDTHTPVCSRNLALAIDRLPLLFSMNCRPWPPCRL